MGNKNKTLASFLAYILVFVVTLAGVNLAWAQNTQSQPTKSTQQTDRAKQARLKSIRVRMQNYANRGQKAFDRLSGVIKKIESRRDKMASAGLDISSLNVLIESAKVQKAEAESAMVAAKEKYKAIDSASDPKAALLEFNKAMKDLRTELSDLQGKLKDVVKTMKDLDKTQIKTKNTNPSATSGVKGIK
jgi:chromosome segregation ATPase